MHVRDKMIEWHEVEPDVAALADRRTHGIVKACVSFYGAAGMATAIKSAYIQGAEDMATLFQERAMLSERPSEQEQ